MRVPSGLIWGSLAASSENRSRASKVREGPVGAAGAAVTAPTASKAAQTCLSIPRLPFVPGRLMRQLHVRVKGSGLPEWRHGVEIRNLVADCLALPLQEVGDGAAEAGVGEIVGGEGGHRAVAAGELVGALCAGLDAGEAAGDRRVDRLIIADFEMEVRHFGDRAPIAAVKRVGADHVERAGDGAAVAQGED